MRPGSRRFSVLGMAISGIFFGFMTAALGQQPAAAPKFIFHDRPFYPIALYNYPVAGGASSQSASSLKEMAAAGFNTLLQYDHDPAWESGQPAITTSFLTTAQSYGISTVDELWTYDNLGQDNWIGMTEMDVANSLLAKQINLIKSHPDLLGYETFDEAAGYKGKGETTKAMLQKGHDFVKSLDPDHLIWCNANPLDTPTQGKAARTWAPIGDTLSCDWYPVDPTWTKPPWPLQGVVDNMDYLYIATDADGAAPFIPTKPIYMTMQGTTINGISPSYSDCRNMVFRTIIHGSVAGLWWGTYQLRPTDQLWLNIKRCAGQLRDLSPVLNQGHILGVVRHDAATGSFYRSKNVTLSNPGLEAIAFRYNRANGDSDNYLIVANTSPKEVLTGSMAVADWNFARNGYKTRVLFETDASGNNRPMLASQGNAWTDTFAPNEVHIYTDRFYTHVDADFDGDGIRDKAVYDRAHGELQITYSSNSRKIYQKCGVSDDVEISDVDGDDKADIAVYDKVAKDFKVLLSTTNYTTSRKVSNIKGTRVVSVHSS